ncbi:hypothetical protein HRG_005173 [Hirsutella rhossiliensis]|uniref:Uncharacterized protein n=1 Tax=Hirsutella rhossiliensis TaxID=111463 RepID=A0A9P8SKH1_9HYPO|nr:uncharacterized protein HRG_05173 [Hirsutella rhossiliensis]KAH0964745.1 hypothetical protein HRG_05173 [Hirsutella rhossiliensis]
MAKKLASYGCVQSSYNLETRLLDRGRGDKGEQQQQQKQPLSEDDIVTACQAANVELENVVKQTLDWAARDAAAELGSHDELVAPRRLYYQVVLS